MKPRQLASIGRIGRGRMECDLEERMVEYVRRRRPPANHPYWQHLHDRAHPPWVVIPVIPTTVLGLGIGLYGGLRDPFTLAEAVRTAAIGSSGVAATTAVIGTFTLFFDAGHQLPWKWRLLRAIGMGTGAGTLLFLITFVAMFVFLAWYAACSGEGAWLGMLYGALIGGTPIAAIVYTYRQRWRDRQKHWPRWERMRTPRSRNRLNLTEVSTNPINPPSVGTAPTEQRLDPHRPRSESSSQPPIGETREET
jgi:hypothetical protein